METLNAHEFNEELLIETCLISKADKYGKITYANDKFCSISGYTLEELIGQDHRIVNSGIHNKDFWRNMYDTVIKEKKTWYATVTNKNKKGELYYVKSWIKGIFNEKQEFEGYISVRQDVTEITEAKIENEKVNKDLKVALLNTEKAKENALNELDNLVKKTQTELIESIVKVSLWIVSGVGVVTTLMFATTLILGVDNKIIESAWSNMFGILLTNSFSIIGTIMGVKYASEKKSKCKCEEG